MHRPFDGANTTCYLAQFFNAVYVLDGDASDPTSVYIYDAGAKTWSKQAVSPGGPDPNDLVAILDHDTNVFYALSKGELYFIDFGQSRQLTLGPSFQPPIVLPASQEDKPLEVTMFDPYSFDVYCVGKVMQSMLLVGTVTVHSYS